MLSTVLDEEFVEHTITCFEVWATVLLININLFGKNSSKDLLS